MERGKTKSLRKVGATKDSFEEKQGRELDSEFKNGRKEFSFLAFQRVLSAWERKGNGRKEGPFAKKGGKKGKFLTPGATSTRELFFLKPVKETHGSAKGGGRNKRTRGK